MVKGVELNSPTEEEKTCGGSVLELASCPTQSRTGRMSGK